MSNIRLANGGGEFGTGATWDGGVSPGTGDTFYADASSGNLTVEANKTVLGYDFTGYTGTLTMTGYLLASGNAGSSINCKFAAGMNFSGSGILYFHNTTASTVINLYTAGKTLANSVRVGVSAANVSSVILQDALTSTSTIVVNSGTLDANGYTITGSAFLSSNSAARTLTLATVNITGTAPLTFTDPTNLTVTPGATWNITNVTATAKTLALAAGVNIGNLAITGGGTGGINITLDGIVTDLTINAPKTINHTSGKTLTITGTVSSDASSGNVVRLQPTTIPDVYTWTKASGTVSIDWWDIRDSVAAGGAAWYAGANSVDRSNNTGWIFTAPPSGTPIAAIMRLLSQFSHGTSPFGGD